MIAQAGDDVSELRADLTRLVAFLRQYGMLYEFHAVDLFQYRWLADTEPPATIAGFLHEPSLREPFLPEEWMQWISATGGATERAWLQAVMEWTRRPADGDTEQDGQRLWRFLTEEFQCPASMSAYFMACRRWWLRLRAHSSKTKGSSPGSMNAVKIKGLSRKKDHEVQRLAHHIHSLIQAYRQQQSSFKDMAVRLVDVGAGQGYLSSLLATRYGYSVLALDHSDWQTRGARQRMVADHTADSVQCVTCRVDAQTVFSALGTDPASNLHGPVGTVLVALHACGELSAHMVRSMAQDPGVVGLVQVPCCYNLLDPGPSSFPLSRHLLSLDPVVRLGQPARMLACQSVWRWGRAQSPAEVEEMFERHYFRCLFQDLLIRTGNLRPEHQEWIAIGRLHRRDFHSFTAYCLASLRKLHLRDDDNVVDYQSTHAPVSTEDTAVEAGGKPRYRDQPLTLKQQHFITHLEENATLQQLLSDPDRLGFLCTDLKAYWDARGGRERVRAVWTLRASLAVAVEALILLDRQSYLLENSQLHDVSLEPIFDEQVSPRNLVLTAFRSTQIKPGHSIMCQ